MTFIQNQTCFFWKLQKDMSAILQIRYMTLLYITRIILGHDVKYDRNRTRTQA